MPLLIKNGEIVTADARYRGRHLVRRGDDHAHRRRPADAGRRRGDRRGAANSSFPASSIRTSTSTCRSWARSPRTPTTRASRAALVGGTTTLIEMVCPSRADDPLEAYELWKSQAAGRSACDYAFHMGVTRFDDKTPEILRAHRRRRHGSFKVFLAYKGAFGIDDAELYRTLELARRLGVIVTAHCENAEIVAQLSAGLLAEGKTGPEWHEPSRPTSVEAEGVHHLATFAELTGAHVYVVHTSCAEALAAARRARGAASICGSKR